MCRLGLDPQSRFVKATSRRAVNMVSDARLSSRELGIDSRYTGMKAGLNVMNCRTLGSVIADQR